VKTSIVAAAVLVVSVLASPGSGGGRRDGVQVDVSNLRGTQSETTIAVDPSNSSVLLAGSNDHRSLHVAAYSSTDGGASWTAVRVPFPPDSDFSGDPIVAIDRQGRQYFGYVSVSQISRRTTHSGLYVPSRAGPSAPWSLPARPVESVAGAFDDKPALAIDDSATSPHVNRIYVGWSRIIVAAGKGFGAIYLAHSDDAGATWSLPVAVSDRRRTFDSYPTIDVARDGTVYVGFWNALGRGIYLDVSHDGGDTFGRDVLVDPIHGRSTCSPAGISIPAQPANCVRPNPIVSVDNSAGPFAGRVYVSYGDTSVRGPKEQDVFVAAFDPAPRVQFRRRRVNPPDRAVRSDQFWPASAVDPSTGIVWACFYDTHGDRYRRRAWYSCTRSLDGGTDWVAPVRAATAPSNERVRGADSRRGRLKREYGDYEGLAVAAGVAHPVWTDTRRLRILREEVFTTTLSDASFRR
jgi:hypothetical protein